MKYRIKLLSDLRQRFRKEYLSELIQKQNDNRVREPRIGEMVLIGNDNKKRLSWPIAKIIELIPGRDGEIRTVRLKTQHGTVIRPVQRIFPLEVQAIANSDKELKEESISVKSTKPEKVLNTNDAIVKKKKYTSSGRLVKEPKRLDLLNYNCYRFETLPKSQKDAGQRPVQVRRRATTPNEDRSLVLTARRHRNMNATLLQQHLRSATGTTVSTQTVQNRLHGVGLYARRSMGPGSRNNPAFVHESVRFSGGVVLVYGGISIEECTDLYIIRDGLLTARRYRDEILRPIVVPYAAAIGDDFILMDDNCRPHRANLEEDFFSRKESNEWNGQRVLQT
ncbi:transposable element Tcb2 transposase [Trichonephila clavipes]|nr:transposable element Tcb2 transposase [Trichonephila clavipes]